jgi:hypothetical protein
MTYVITEARMQLGQHLDRLVSSLSLLRKGLVEATRASRTRDWLGWLLLAVSFLIGFSTIYVNEFMDEADNLVGGLLLARGYVLYRDLFSHHFPFPYYWAAAVISLFGKSIFAVRLSVWLFQIASFAIVMRLSRLYLTFGLAALLWSLIRHFYRANMILYSVFAGTSLLVVFGVVLMICLGHSKIEWKHSLTIGLFSTIAFLSDPLSIYAILVVIIFLLTIDFKQANLTLLFIAAGLLSYGGFLFVTGTFGDFARDAVLFNSQVYARYEYADPLRFRTLWYVAIRGLEIASPKWLDFDPFRAISYSGFDGWVFTGFLYRLSIVISTILLLLQKDFRAAGFMYLFSCATLANKTSSFRATGFVMVALVAISGVISGEWWQKRSGRISKLRVVASILIGVMALWLGLRVAAFTYIQDRDNLSYETPFAWLEAEAEEIRKLTCGQTDVLLASYPGAQYHYWFTEMRPVSRYIVMWPWVAEVGLADVLSTLAQEQATALVIIRGREVRGQHTRDYLHSLFEYLDDNYTKIAEGVYISPHLARKCQE